MDKPKYEVGSIKCYQRPSKDKGKPNFQRRILLKSNGILAGCPDNEDPLHVVVVKESDFNSLLDYVSQVENEKAALNKELHISENKLKTLVDKPLADTQRNDELKHTYEKQIKELESNINNLNGELTSLGANQINWDAFEDLQQKYDKLNSDYLEYVKESKKESDKQIKNYTNLLAMQLAPDQILPGEQMKTTEETPQGRGIINKIKDWWNR